MISREKVKNLKPGTLICDNYYGCSFMVLERYNKDSGDQYYLLFDIRENRISKNHHYICQNDTIVCE